MSKDSGMGIARAAIAFMIVLLPEPEVRKVKQKRK